MYLWTLCSQKVLPGKVMGTMGERTKPTRQNRSNNKPLCYLIKTVDYTSFSHLSCASVREIEISPNLPKLLVSFAQAPFKPFNCSTDATLHFTLFIKLRISCQSSFICLIYKLQVSPTYHQMLLVYNSRTCSWFQF